MNKINIGIIDDHIMFAQGIGNIVTSIDYINVQMIATKSETIFEGNNLEVLDLIIVDINLQEEENGLQLLSKLKTLKPNIKVIVVSMYLPNDINLNTETFKGEGYVLKVSGKEILLAAIESAIINKQYWDPNIKLQTPINDKFTVTNKLTKREKEIVDYIAAGKTSKEIAAILFLSEHTIKSHRKHIYEKLETKGIASILGMHKN